MTRAIEWRRAIVVAMIASIVVACSLSIRAADPGDDRESSHPVLPRTTPAQSAGDPAEEGWQAEAFSEQALQQWQAFGVLITAPSIDAQAWQAIVADDFVAPPLWPTHVEKPFADGRLVQVDHQAQPDPLPSTTTSAARALEPLRAAFASWSDLKTKFKLYRVVAQGKLIETHQYFHLAGTSPTSAREHNATWVARWRPDGRGGLPRLQSIQIEQAETVTIMRSSRPWLVDSTRSLLGATNADALRAWERGIAHWESHFDSSFGVFNFGFHGVAIADVNGDDRDDVYVCEPGGLPNRLLVQQPDGTVIDEGAAAHVDYLDNTRSALFVDLDNDDDVDLILALSTGLIFLENDGHGHFLPRARIASVREAFSLAAADYDRDGWVDVYACVYYGDGNAVTELPLPLPYFDAKNGGRDHLIRNQGDWKFEDATATVGLDDENNRFTFAAVWEDLDGDGDLDLLVVNDFGPNQLYMFDGTKFHNVARDVGLMDGAFGMGATITDFDHDTRPDIYVSNMFSAAGNRITFDPRFKPEESAATRARFQHLARGNSLFRNLGQGKFQDVSQEAGVAMGRWSWGSMFCDLNNDGWDDLLVANGFVTGPQSDDL